ncbi:2Fe-2S iron-sulfur cluster-binding protein [Streptomyces sp. NPDC056500]|uniref:2Fe-2S iron-sulfur cluster-binding protein n=1 Tax=Streptomyces sp. NPDC056500 TaxID=3345840 RepID=UPI003699E01E
MSNEEHPQGHPAAPPGHPYEHGGWQPTPHGEYDPEGTAFVQLPAEDVPHAAPLEAPGHGYVPPTITPPTPNGPPSAPAWPTVQHTQGHPGEYGWPDPAGHPQGAPNEDPHATGQWSIPTAEHPPQAPESTGQWTIPLAGNDVPDETGEYTTAMLQSQWSSAPATLPGGATAPWATDPSATLPGGAPAPWATNPPEQQEQPADTAQREPDHPRQAAAGEAPVEHALVADGVPANTSSDSEDAALPEVSAEGHPSDPAPADVDADERTDGEAADEPTRAEGDPQPTALREPTDDTTSADGPDTPPEPRTEPAEDLEAEVVQDATAEDPGRASAADEHPPTSYVLRVNGTDRPVTEAWIGESLLYVLRERLGLAGAKDGCSQGECGACNVQVDGRLVASCLVPAATTAGSEVRTVEGLATDGEPSDVQRALATCGAVQCGFCIPGMAMTVHDLLEGNHKPTELETRRALCGNLCRCSGYRGVLDAVREVVAGREASAAAAAEASEAAADQAPEARIPHQAPPGAGSVQPHPHDGGMA